MNIFKQMNLGGNWFPKYQHKLGKKISLQENTFKVIVWVF